MNGSALTAPDKPQPDATEPKLDIDAQLDDLLDQVEQIAPPEASEAKPVEAEPVGASVTSNPEDEDQHQDDLVGADDFDISKDDFVAVDQMPQDPIGLELANEIQQLLNDDRPSEVASETASKASGEVASEAMPKSTSDFAQAPPETSAGDAAAPAEKTQEPSNQGALDPTAVLSATAAELFDPEADAATKQSPPDQSEQAGLSLQDIDQMLADEADDAIAGDFETVNEVMEDQAQAQNQFQEQAPTQSQPGPAARAETDDQSSIPFDPQSSTDPTNQDNAADLDEEGLEGSFQTPEALITAAAVHDHQRQTQRPDFTAQQDRSATLSQDAQAVARELDEQPENDPDRSSTQTHTKAEASSRRGAKPSFLERWVGVSGESGVLRQLCTTINRPLEGMSSQSRDMVGYAGLITLFWGGVTIGVKIIGVMLH